MESMENPAATAGSPEMSGAALIGGEGTMTRKEKRKALKKLKRKQLRREMAIREKELDDARANDPEEQNRLRKLEEEERERVERDRREFEERERMWIEAKKRREEEEEAERQRKLLEESEVESKNKEEKSEEEEEFEFIEEGPAEIIWKGNEIIVKKKKVKIPKKSIQNQPIKDVERPISNPLPPNSESFSSNSAQEILEKIAQETPNFGTEQDKAHCPFHIKTGACRFGTRCTRLHFYPEKSCTLLMKNMYNGPGLAFEQDEGLEHSDEEIERSYEEFYEDVHTEFLKFGELVNFKVCRNGSYHLRGNVYVHYKSLDSALLAFHNINGRFFAGKLITCEFVGVTKWKVAICGEYMKSRLKTCSRGNSCNFIHCFRNPGGDYEWADFDKPPPKSWIRKMVSLFGFSDQSYYATKALESEVKQTTPTSDRYSSRSRRDDSDLERDYSRRKKDCSHSRERYFERHRGSSHKNEDKNKSNSKIKRENEKKSESKRKRKEEKIELSIDEERYKGCVSPKDDFDLDKEYCEIKHHKEYSEESTRQDSKRMHRSKNHKEKYEYLDSEERKENNYYDYREYKRGKKVLCEDKSGSGNKK